MICIFLLHRLHLLCCFISICACCSSVFQSPFSLVFPLVFLLCFSYDAYFLTTSITPFVLFYKYLWMLFFCLSVSLLAGFPISILTLFLLWYCIFLLHRLHLLCCFISICACCFSVFQSPGFPAGFAHLIFLLCFYYDAYFLTTSITPFVLFYKYLCMLFFCLSVSLLAGFPH